MQANPPHCAQMMLALLVVMVSAPVQADRTLLDQVVPVVNSDVILPADLAQRLNTISALLRALGP